MNVGAYCRAVESYLCRKNDGHLVRIVGPSFDLVCNWANNNIPLSVVERAIDSTYVRYYASGRTRRPVRIEYCEHDVLDLYGEWKRAVGLTDGTEADMVAPSGENDEVFTDSRHPRRSIATHLNEVANRLSAWMSEQHSFSGSTELDRQVVEIMSAIEAARVGAEKLRGKERLAVIERLQMFDGALLASARAAVDGNVLERLHLEAIELLEPFRSRMAVRVFEEAVHAETNRLLAGYYRLPLVSY